MLKKKTILILILIFLFITFFFVVVNIQINHLENYFLEFNIEDISNQGLPIINPIIIGIFLAIKILNISLSKVLSMLESEYLRLSQQEIFRQLTFSWQIFVITFSNIADTLWLIIFYLPIYFLYSISILPIIQAILFSGSGLLKINSIFIYSFLVSIIFYVLAIFINLLSLSKSKSYHQQKASVKNISKSFIFIIGIIIIPLFFLIMNNAIFMFMKLIISPISNNNFKYFSPSLLIMNSVYYSGILTSIPFVPMDPITGDLILLGNFSYAMFWIGIAILLVFEIFILVFIFKRLMTILYYLIFSPFALAKDTIDDNNWSTKKWLKKTVKEFFGISLLVFSFMAILLSLESFKFIFSSFVEKIPYKIMNYIFFEMLLVTNILMILNFEKIFNGIFLREKVKVKGNIMEQKLQENELKFDSSYFKELNLTINKTGNLQRENIAKNKKINKSISRIEDEINKKKITELNSKSESVGT